MAISFSGTNEDRRYTIGALDGYTIGASTFAALIKRDTAGSWDGIMTIADTGTGDGGTPVLIDAIEISNVNDFVFWNGRSGGAVSVNGDTVSTYSDTTNWWIVAMTWAGTTALPRFHWKQLSAGGWTHEDITEGFPFGDGDCLPCAAADIIILGTDPTGGDDFGGDFVWAGIKKAALSDGQIETLDTLNFSTVVAAGWDWGVSFQNTTTAQADFTGGGGNQSSGSGSIVSDPGGWNWTIAGPAQRFMWMP